MAINPTKSPPVTTPPFDTSAADVAKDAEKNVEVGNSAPISADALDALTQKPVYMGDVQNAVQKTLASFKRTFTPAATELLPAEEPEQK